MANLLSIALFTATVAASILQQPLQDNHQTVLIDSAKTLVDSEALQAHISSKNLLKRAEKLFEIAELGKAEYNHPTRVIGSQGHLATLDYIYSTIADLGDYYEISNQTFPAVIGNVFESRLVLGDHEPPSTRPMSLTPPTKKRKVVIGPLVYVENQGCDKSDYPSNTKGGIAFIERGICSFGAKSEAAGRAGAIAVVIYNNGKGSLSGTLERPSEYHVATFGISLEDAQPYLKALKAGKTIDSSAYIDAIVRETGTTNIIAQTTGGDQDNCVMLGGHSDSVGEGPGINDDGTGLLTLLEVATHLVNYRITNCVRFAWWAAEEEGLLGSAYYVGQLSDKEKSKIRLFMDYDMLASPNFAYQVYNATNAINPAGSEELRDLYTDYYKAHGQNYTYIPFDGRSDYDAFIRGGIPGGGIATGAEGVKTKEEAEMFGGTPGKWFDPCYHQLCDDLGNLALDAWELNAKLVAHTVATYAASLEDFPKRTTFKSYDRDQPSLYYGPQLRM